MRTIEKKKKTKIQKDKPILKITEAGTIQITF